MIGLCAFGAEWRTRTADPRITNALLYQLSQFGKTNVKNVMPFVKSDAKVVLFFIIATNFIEIFLKFARKKRKHLLEMGWKVQER